MVYWPVLSETQWKERVAEQERAERARLALEMITADKVTCGEQQPESDHFVAMDRSRNGDHNGRHWRMAMPEGWFSYTMNTRGHEVKHLRITCTGREGSEAVVTMNGIEAGTFRTSAPNTEETLLVPVPEQAVENGQVNVRISAAAGKASPMIYEVRLVIE